MALSLLHTFTGIEFRTDTALTGTLCMATSQLGSVAAMDEKAKAGLTILVVPVDIPRGEEGAKEGAASEVRVRRGLWLSPGFKPKNDRGGGELV